MKLLVMLLLLYVPGSNVVGTTTYVDKVEKNTVIYKGESPQLTQWLFYDETKDRKMVICGWATFKEEQEISQHHKTLVIFERGRRKVIRFGQYQESITDYDKEVMWRVKHLSEHPEYRINKWLTL